MGKKKRFIETYSQDNFMDNTYKVIVDTETGVNYLFIGFSNYSGFTVLLDKDGKPVVSDVKE